MPTIYVLGSLNMDTTYYVATLPGQGETIMSRSAETAMGGKGFNQAIAASWSGAETKIIGAVGTDASGALIKNALVDNHIDVTLLKEVTNPTGSAVIFVDDQGKNLIVVNGGANRHVDVGYAPFAEGDWLIAQLETPIPVVEYYMEMAKKAGAKTVLNLSPSQAVGEKLLSNVDMMIVNEHEAGSILGTVIDTTENVYELQSKIRKSSIRDWVITLGANGVVVYNDGVFTAIPGIKVQAVDTQGAGDAFAGVLIGTYMRTGDLIESARRANRIASECVTVTGSTLLSLKKIEADKE